MLKRYSLRQKYSILYVSRQVGGALTDDVRDKSSGSGLYKDDRHVENNLREVELKSGQKQLEKYYPSLIIP